MELSFLGATGTVTGSKYLVRAGAARVLVDCGLFQGYKQLRLRNWAQPPFAPQELDAVVLTHAHVDHSGYLPLLVRRGYAGPVYCTEATAELCKVLLPDAGRLQEEEAEYANREGYSRHHPALPLYTEQDALRALRQLKPVAWERDVEVAPGLRARLSPAGHILGSALVRLHDGATSLLFSGDLGRPNDFIMHPPAVPAAADYLVVESTYGNRHHPAEDALAQLGAIVRRTAQRGGAVIIPSFAVGRTQTLLWALHLLKRRGEIPDGLPVYLNSPMAVDVTRIYHRFRAEHRLEPDQCAAMCHAAHIVQTVEESRRLNLRRGPMVVIAGSGMATGGRVLHHLRAFAPQPENTILLVGFQAGGTRGAALLEGAEAVKIHGQYVPVRAEVAALGTLSAHADAGEILDWLRRFPAPPKAAFVTHGEPAAADALRRAIREQLGWDCRVPEFQETVALSAPPAAAGAAAGTPPGSRTGTAAAP